MSDTRAALERLFGVPQQPPPPPATVLVRVVAGRVYKPGTVLVLSQEQASVALARGWAVVV